MEYGIDSERQSGVPRGVVTHHKVNFSRQVRRSVITMALALNDLF